MFPSSGYFRGVNCPYFASGLCDRACCHFRHSKPQEEKQKESLPSYSAKTGPSYSFNSSQISGYCASPYLQKSIAGYIDNYSKHENPNQSSSQESLVSNDCNSTKRESNSVCPIPSFSESPSALPESAPEPEIDRRSLPKISGLAKRKISTPPSYNPTPKACPDTLETDSRSDDDAVPSYHPTPKSISGTGTARGASGKRNIIQYDPVKNYAVNPKQHSSASDEDDEPKQQTTSTSDAEFSEPEEESEHNELADSQLHEQLESHDRSDPKTPVPSYADLLTPSSYFTGKLSSLSSNSRPSDNSVESDSSVSIHRNGCLEKQSSSHSVGTDKLSKSSCHSSTSHSTPSSKKENKSSSHSGSSSLHKDHKGSKSHSVTSSSSKSSSSSRTSSSTKTTSLSHNSKNHNKHSSSERNEKSCHDSREHRSDSTSKREKSSSSSGSKSSHSSRRPSHSSGSDSKHSGTNRTKHCSGDDVANGSEKQSDHKKHESKHSRSSSSDSKHSDAKRTKHISGDKVTNCSEQRSGHKKNESRIDKCTSKSSPSSSSSLVSRSSHAVHRSTSVSELNKKSHSGDGAICRSISSSEKVKKLHKDDTKVKEERRSSLDANNKQSKKNDRDELEKYKSRHVHSDHSKTKHNEKERRKSNDPKREKVKSEVKLEKKSARERRLSDLASHLFGEESDGSDSDVQIVEPPPEPPPVVLELTDSDEGEQHSDAAMLSEEDLDFSDTDTFDECLRIFQETDRKLKFQSRSAPNSALKENEAIDKGVPDGKHVVPGKKRMAHPSAQQVVRPVKTPVSTKPRMGPAEVMHNRIVEMQKRALLRAARREGREADLPRHFKNDSITSAAAAASNHHSPNKNIVRQPATAMMATSASSLLLNHRKREAHLPPPTPTKTTPTANNHNIWSPNSFYTKKKPPPQQHQGRQGEGDGAVGGGGRQLVTIAGTASKTEKRKAHVPTSVNLKRPLIAVGDSSKVPVNVRQRYLNFIIDEFLKFCQEETAFQKGQEEEEEVYKRATNKNIYLRVAVNAIKRIRTEAAMAQPSSSKKTKLDLSAMASRGSSAVSQSHEATLGGSRAAKTSFTVNRSGPHRVQTEFKGLELYKRLKKYIMTEEQLRENSYPRPSEDGKSKAKYYTTKKKDILLKDNERLCRRCGKRYYIGEDGAPVSEQECIYHYSNLYKKKVAGSLDSRYGCCSERAGVKGCQVALTHVNESNKYEILTGYMKTLPASESDPKNTKVLSLDCEMVYTKAGMELARVTVIGDECQVLYETFVKPDTDIIDYNTRFSGITAKDMKGVQTTLRGVQAVMLSMISDKTILIGHSLESDMTALKMIHNTVVDTSLVFPHRLGLPYKRALRNLMVDHLQKIIQTDDGGHDSKEDAVSCMQLMMYKVKQDAKSEGRRF